MSTKPVTIPPKVLSQAILSTGSTFVLNNIEGWDGTDLTSASFGTVAFGAFMSPDRTLLELFSFDPATIASASISFVDRGLAFTGENTVVTANKLDWPAGTIVMLGTDTPQYMLLLAALGNTNAFTGANSFTLLPTSTGGDATSGTQLITYAQALALATGTASINRIVVAGNAGETVTAGQLLYLDVADGEWKKCDADTAGSVDNIILGIAQGAGTDGVAITSGVLLFGLDSNQTGLTTNTAYYASNTAGGISTTPGTTEVSVGISRSTTSILFYPRYNQQLTESQQDALAGDNGTPSGTNLFVTQSGLQIGAELYAADAGANDTYVITLSPVPAAYVTGMVIRFKANTANTGAATINVNSLGAKTIVKYVNTTLADNDIAAGMYCTLIYDGTNFVLQNPIANIITPSSSYIVNADETLVTYYTWTTPLIVSTDSGPTYVIKGFTGTAISNPGSKNGGAGITDLSWPSGAVISSEMQGNGSNDTYTAASSKDIRIKYRLKYQGAYGASKYFGIGLADATTTFDDIESGTAAGIRFVLNNATLYTSTGTGAANTNNNVSASLTYTDWNIFEIVFNPGTDVKFYINGTLVATHSTNIPTGSLQLFGIGATDPGNLAYISPITFSIEQ